MRHWPSLAPARMTQSLRHRLWRRRAVPWIWWQVPVVSPYSDRLRDAAFDGHYCQMFRVVIG